MAAPTMTDSTGRNQAELIAMLTALRGLDGSATVDPASILDGDEVSGEITVTGAVLGDFVLASFSLDTADLVLAAAVTATDTVTWSILNNTGGTIDLASGTLRVRVLPRA